MSTAPLTKLLSTDFCPWANRYVYCLKKPIGILGLAAIASLLCGLFVAPQGLVIAATIAATIILGMVWPWIGLRGLSCELRFPQRRGMEGQASSVEVVVRNRWPFPVWGLAIEEGFFLTNDGEDGTAVALSGIRGWSKTKFCWNFQPECRGVYPTKSAKIATEFPFGVWKARRNIDAIGELIVWPRTIALEAAVLTQGANRSLLQPSDKKSGNEGERIGVRAYREGDSLRFVHWAQTAKCGRLIVSERQGPAQSTAVVAINAEKTVPSQIGPNSIFECSIRIGASLCEQLTRQNATVQMVVNGESWEVQPTGLSRQHSMDRLAAIATSTRSHEPSSQMQLGAFSKHEERFVITTSTQSEDWGPSWKTIVLIDGESESPAPTWDEPSHWILIDCSAEPLPQFAKRWSRAIRQAWCGEGRGVA